VLEGARNLYWRLSLRNNLFYFGQLKGVPYATIRQRLPSILKLMQLEDLADQMVGRLSAGQRQRAAIAVALIHSPDVLVLDEPTNGLDIPSIDSLISVLQQLRCQESTTILLSSHNMAFVQALADTVVFINRGRLISTLSTNELDTLAQGSRYRFILSEQYNLAEKVQKILPEANFDPETLSVTVTIPLSETLSAYLARLSSAGIVVRSADRIDTDLAAVYRQLLSEER